MRHVIVIIATSRPCIIGDLGYRAHLSLLFVNRPSFPAVLRRVAGSWAVTVLTLIRLQPTYQVMSYVDFHRQVLKQRIANNDRVAQVLIEQHSRTVAFQSPCRLCRPMKTLVATITGRKLEVSGRNGSIRVATM